MRKALLIALFLMTPLFAERAGPVIAVGGGYTQFINDDDFVPLKNNYSNAARLALGAYINENLSVMLEFNYLGAYDTQISTNTLSVANVSTLAHLPLLQDRLDISAKFGAGELWWQEEAQFQNDDTTSTLITGVALAYRLNYTYSLHVGADVYHFSYRKSSNEPTIDLRIVNYFAMLEYQF